MISRDFLELQRRRRFAVAAAEICHEFGLDGITVSTLVQVAGTARNSFYELFANATDCLSFALEEAHETFFAPVRAAADPDGEDWGGRLDAALAELFDLLAADLPAADLYLVHSYGVARGGPGLGPREGASDLERLLQGGRQAAARIGRELPASAEEYWASAILAVAATAVRHRRTLDLPGKATALSALVVSSFLDARPRPAGATSTRS